MRENECMFSATDNSMIAGLTGLAGLTSLTIGISFTAMITKLIEDSEKDRNQRIHNLIARKDLTQNSGKDNEYDVIKSYKTRLSALFNVIQQHYGLEKKNEFEKIIMSSALCIKSDEKDSHGNKMVYIPDLSIGLIKRNWLKHSGIDESIIEIFEAYKIAKVTEKEGIDVNVAMMQILQNIIIIYKEFITENKNIPENIIAIKEGDDRSNKLSPGKLEAVNTAMTTFVKELENSCMFRDRSFKLIQFKETKRQMNLPKIVKLINDMGEEAVNFQRKLTIIGMSNEKFKKLWNAASYFAQSLERMSESAIYKLPRLDCYSPYKRKDGIIYYDIHSWNDSVSDKNDLMANVIIKHMRNAYSTFLTNFHKENKNEEFSHTNYLINLSSEPTSYEEFNKINLPSIAYIKTRTEKFNQALNECDLKNVIPYVNQYFNYIYIAAAMQADLSTQLNALGWQGLSLSGELEDRLKLISIFTKRALEIARNDILGETAYFRQFIERTNDADFINEALNQDESFYNTITNHSHIIKADKDKQYDATPNAMFNISLNHMLHAEAMKKAGDEFHDIEIIDKKLSSITNSKSFNESIATNIPSKYDDEFYYHLATICQDDNILKENILGMNGINGNINNLKQYIHCLDTIKRYGAELFEDYIFPQENIADDDYTYIKTKFKQEYKIKGSILNKFHLFMKEQSNKKQAIFKLGESYQYKRNDFLLKNKENILEYRNNIASFIKELIAEFNGQFHKKYHMNEYYYFFLSLEKKCNRLIKYVDQLNNGINIDEKEIENLKK